MAATRALAFAAVALLAPGVLRASDPEEQKFDPPARMVVVVPVADVRAKPVPSSGGYERDRLQETQVVEGEIVLVFERKGDWARVACSEQEEYTHNDRWEAYPGWVQWSALSPDLSKAKRPARPDGSEDDLRLRIVEKAALHLGNTYLWGGRSLHDPRIRGVATGVDCSGLVSWSYREVGLFPPRDAHEQFMKAFRVEPADLQPGDLVFQASPDSPNYAVHVLIYAGGEELIESPTTGGKVRRISFEKRFGIPRLEMRQEMEAAGRVNYFGSLLRALPKADAGQ